MSAFKEPEKRYLGDGVYAEYDGYHVVLSTQGSVESELPQRIFLDPHTLEALVAYVTGPAKETPDDLVTQ